MAMDATFQIRMNSESKTDVENLYRSLGTSFAEAVRIFAQQISARAGCRLPLPWTWDELTRDEIDAKLRKSTADISAGRTLSQDQLDAKIAELPIRHEAMQNHLHGHRSQWHHEK